MKVMYSHFDKYLSCFTFALIIGFLGFVEAKEAEIAYEGEALAEQSEAVHIQDLGEKTLCVDNQEDRGIVTNGRKGINPTARGCRQENGPYITIDFLYWKALESEVDLVANTPDLLSTGSLVGKITLEKLRFNYDPGFQMGLGYNLDYDNWDVYSNWTSITNRSTTDNADLSPTFLILPFGIPATGSPALASNYSTHWKLEYNTFDVEVGRDFFASKYLSFRPLGSIRVAWLQRSIECHFDGMNSNYVNVLNPGSMTSNGPIDLHFHNGFWGVGPRFGLNSRWLLGDRGFGLLANISGSFLGGVFTNRMDISIHDAVASKGAIVRPRIYTTRINADMAMGFDYGHCFDDWFYIYTSASYNITYWWNALGTVGYANSFGSQRNDVSLSGFNLQLRLDF